MRDDPKQPAVGYTRVSTDEQAREGLSLDAQHNAILDHCEGRGWIIEWVHEDAGISGKRADNRPSLAVALNEVCRTRGVLVVHALSRLARNVLDFEVIMQRLLKAGATIESISERVDITTPTGRAVARLIVMMAVLEIEQTGERVALAHAHRRKQEGKHWCAGYKVPYGSRRDSHGTLVRHKREAQRCKQMLDWRRAGWSYGRIAARLNKLRVPTKQGGDGWSASVVSKVTRAEAARRKIELPADVSPLRGDVTKQAEIRKLYASGKYTMPQLAEKYGCHKTSIWRVIHDKS